MLSSISRSVEVFLAAVAAGLVAALLVPWGEPVQQTASAPARLRPPEVSGTASVQPDRAQPWLVASLFSRRGMAGTVTRAPAAAAAAKNPVEAPWLRYLGFYNGASGASYLLKDTRTGRVIRVAGDAASSGWTLVEIGDRSMIVRNHEETYVVSKR